MNHSIIQNHLNSLNISDALQLTKCGWDEFCGHVVAETYSTYYRCSCPAGAFCVHQDNTPRNASELLYRGPTFRAHCFPSWAYNYHPCYSLVGLILIHNMASKTSFQHLTFTYYMLYLAFNIIKKNYFIKYV